MGIEGDEGDGWGLVSTCRATAGTSSPFVVSKFAARCSTRRLGRPPSATESIVAPRSGRLRADSFSCGSCVAMVVGSHVTVRPGSLGGGLSKCQKLRARVKEIKNRKDGPGVVDKTCYQFRGVYQPKGHAHETRCSWPKVNDSELHRWAVANKVVIRARHVRELWHTKVQLRSILALGGDGNTCSGSVRCAQTHSIYPS